MNYSKSNSVMIPQLSYEDGIFGRTIDNPALIAVTAEDGLMDNLGLIYILKY